MSINGVKLEIERQDGLCGQTWGFALLGDKLVLNYYTTWRRSSKRHKPVTHEHWSRLIARESNIKKADVPLTLAIAEQAKSVWLKQLEDTVTVEFQS